MDLFYFSQPYQMIKKILYLFIPIGILITIINGCDKHNDTPINSVYLLTNDSSKIWCLSKIINADLVTVIPYPCVIDDEHKFQMNGKCLIDNKGTTFGDYNSPNPISPPKFCKDTVDVIYTAQWKLSTKMDSLTISTTNYVLTGKILKLTPDSLIIKRTYKDLIVQTEYYFAKK